MIGNKSSVVKENHQSETLLSSLSELLFRWKEALQSSSFRIRCILTVCALVLVVSFVPAFFFTVQHTQGIYLNDLLLEHLPAYDVSLFVFIPLYALMLATVFLLAFQPELSLKALQAYLLLLVMRGSCIYLFPLEPHHAIIPLVDPLVDRFFYDQVVVTKDLFFSGHVSTMYLLCLALPSQKYRKAGILLTVAVAFLLLVQHAHYTVDVLVAPFAAWLSWKAVNTTKN